MRLHYSLCISFLLIFMCALAPYSAKASFDKLRMNGSTKKKIMHSDNSEKKYVILFDLMNVIIKENHVGFAKKIGYGNLASYTLIHWKNPGYRCLDMLDAMSKHETQKPHIRITLHKRIMPRCLIELQEGKKTALQTKDEILQSIELLDTQKHFSSTKEKLLMTDIMSLILDPHETTSMIKPIKSTIQLVQKLKSAGCSVGIFANVPTELYATLQKKYPEIINLFDRIIISSEVKTVKPDRAMFNHLFTTYNLLPQDCILIDDLEETVAAAQQLGMHAFIYDKNVMNKLRKYGVKI